VKLAGLLLNPIGSVYVTAELHRQRNFSKRLHH